MRLCQGLCVVIMVVLIAGTGALAATISVPADQPTIQAAINAAAAGDTIQVAAGTYDEPLNIDGKSNLSIVGADKTTTIVKSSTVLPWNIGGYGTSRNSMVRIVNSTASLSGLTLDCDLIKGNSRYAVSGWDSNITLDDCVVKNMSVSDALGGYTELGVYCRATGFTDAVRATAVVSNCTFIDAGRVAFATHDYMTSTITDNTFYKTFDDFGYAIELGSQSEGVISGNTIYGYDTPAAIDGSESAGIYIENCFTGALPHVDKDVTIEGNNIYGCQYGLWIGNGYDGYAGDVDIAITLTGNTIHDNVDGGAIIQDEDMAAGSSVTVTGSGNQWLNNGDAGLHIFTQGDGNVSVSLSGDTISGHVDGILVEDFGSPSSTSSYSIALNYCNITGNSDQGVQNDVSTVTVDATSNWWGDASGPNGEGSGSGDSVSANVDYSSWLGGGLPLGDTRYTVTPPLLATGKPEFSEPHGTGTNPFGYDWDSAILATAAGAPAGYGNSSVYGSVVNSSDGLSPDAEAYRALRIGLRSLFGHEVTIGQVAKITYYTNKPAPASSIDWRLSIYTTWDPADPAGNRSSWYRNRIQNHPQSALSLDAPASQWNLWSTDVGTNQMLFGTNRSGFTAEDMAWSELTAGPVTRTGTWDFSGEEVMMIDILLGANSGGGTGESQLDGVRIELTTGQVADIDLSAGTTWNVASVHAHDQFAISADRSILHYDMQPRNTNGWYWFQNNGAAPDVLATGGFQVPDGYRDGSRTFACTDVAVGQRLSDLKLVFDYKHSLGGYTTINFFMTDGNGKFGIFAPTSRGLSAIAQTQVLDADWTRMTIDLTDPSIPDSAEVAVYEHNGFVDVYGDPFTTMTWGDIKNYTIAGMYDYQRSPAYGWNRWGTMFGPINTAGDSAVVNGNGLALIWGDTVGNVAYATGERELRNVTVTFDGVDYLGSFADAQVRDVLELNVSAATIYVKPGETVDVTLDVLKLQQEVKACQAIMGYDSAYLACTGVAIPTSGPWNDLIYGEFSTLGEIDSAVGVYGESNPAMGTTDDSTVAEITLVADSTPGLIAETQVIFRDDVSDVESTFLSDMTANAVWPTTFSSQTIVIDGVNPDIEITSASQAAQELIGTGTNAVQGTVDITVAASDGWAGLAARPVVTVTDSLSGAMAVADNGADLVAGEFYYTVTVAPTTANGIATIEATVSDLAGNPASDSKTFNVNKNQITGVIELQGVADGVSRDVVFVATGAIRAEWTVTVGPFVGNQASFLLADVPGGVTHLSAKTAWNLRRKVAVAFDGDGQAVPPVAMTGADMLLGGDLNGTNSINILDYTVMKINWAGTAPEADINGDGVITTPDYTIMRANWAQVGDDE